MTMTLNSRAVSRSVLSGQVQTIIGSQRSPWSVIVPEATTNMILNPSFELNTTGWTFSGAGGSFARDSGYIGTASGRVTRSGANAFIISDRIFVSASTTYTLSLYVYRPTNLTVRMILWEYDSGLSFLGDITKTINSGVVGKWTYQTHAGRTRSNTASVEVALVLDTNGTVYWDAIQLEQKPYATTYCDGDQEGCYWIDTPHASKSQRFPNDRRGGRVWNFKDFKFWTNAIIGGGAAALSTVITPYALIGGGNYQRSIAPPRDFSIVGGFECDSDIDLKRNRQAMINALAPYAANVDQPARLIYAPVGCDDETGSRILIDGVYTGGLEGNWINDLGGENVALSFRTFLPLAVLGKSENDNSQALTLNDDWPGLTGVFKRNLITGDIEDTTLALPAMPNILVSDGVNSVYALGVFSGGVYNMYRLQPDSGTGDYMWFSISTANGQINDAMVGANGYLYVAGNFTSIGGVGTTGVAYWNGSAWNALSTTTTGVAGGAAQGIAIKVAANGYIYLGGDFTSVDSVAAANIAYWNGAAWNAMGAGVDNDVFDIDTDALGNVYAGGSFDNAGGAAALGFAKWNGSAWSNIGDTGSSANFIRSILVSADGRIYVAGHFTSMGGVTAAVTAYYNGAAWSAMGSGLSPSGVGALVNLSQLKNGNISVTGNTFTSAGGLTTARSAEWTGSQWLPGDIQAVGTSSAIGKIISTVDYEYFVATAATELFTSEATTATNASCQVSPTLKLIGPGRVYSLRNWTTGDRVSFNLVLLTGETAALKFGNLPTFISSARGDIMSTVLPGSSIATFRLVRGTNYITMLYDDTDAAADAFLVWRNEYDSLDGSTP